MPRENPQEVSAAAGVVQMGWPALSCLDSPFEYVRLNKGKRLFNIQNTLTLP